MAGVIGVEFNELTPCVISEDRFVVHPWLDLLRPGSSGAGIFRTHSEGGSHHTEMYGMVFGKSKLTNEGLALTDKLRNAYRHDLDSERDMESIGLTMFGADWMKACRSLQWIPLNVDLSHFITPTTYLVLLYEATST